MAATQKIIDEEYSEIHISCTEWSTFNDLSSALKKKVLAHFEWRWWEWHKNFYYIIVSKTSKKEEVQINSLEELADFIIKNK